MDEVKKDALSIVVDDGTVVVPINNTLGEQVGMFRFRPTDFNIVKRYNQIAEDFDDDEPFGHA